MTGPPKLTRKGIVRRGHRLTPSVRKHPRINLSAGHRIQTQRHHARCSLISHQMPPVAARLPSPGS